MAIKPTPIRRRKRVVDNPVIVDSLQELRAIVDANGLAETAGPYLDRLTLEYTTMRDRMMPSIGVGALMAGGFEVISRGHSGSWTWPLTRWNACTARMPARLRQWMTL